MRFDRGDRDLSYSCASRPDHQSVTASAMKLTAIHAASTTSGQARIFGCQNPNPATSAARTPSVKIGRPFPGFQLAVARHGRADAVADARHRAQRAPGRSACPLARRSARRRKWRGGWSRQDFGRVRHVLLVVRLHCLCDVASSIATSSSQLPSQLLMLRFVDPMRAHRESATAVLACIIEPFHSKMRTPESSSERYSVREIGTVQPTSLPCGRSSRTSTPPCDACCSASTYGPCAEEIGVGDPQPTPRHRGNEQIDAQHARRKRLEESAAD